MDLNKTSKFISLILRHKPETIDISLDEHGWASVSELLEGISKKQYIDMAMLEKIVATDSKQRYSFNEDKTLIRANQGHSIPVDVELPVKKLQQILMEEKLLLFMMWYLKERQKLIGRKCRDT